MPAKKDEEVLTVYAVHDYHDPRPFLLTTDYATAYESVTPRSQIHTIQIPASRWVSVEEINGRTTI